jgi:hypothetical protein
MTTITNTTDLNEAVTLMVAKGGYSSEELAPLMGWLQRGDDVIVFSLADLGAIGSGRPLYWAMPWERNEPTPPQAPDTEQCGLGWRYLPTMRVTVADAQACTCDPPRFVSPDCPRHGAQEYHGAPS